MSAVITTTRPPAEEAIKPAAPAQTAPARKANASPLRFLHGKEGVLFLVALLLLWQGVSLLKFKGGYLFPTPWVTLVALRGSFTELLQGTVSSFLILIPGHFLAVVAGIVWGLLVGTTPVLARAFSPFSRVASPVPPTIYVPYAIALLPSFRTAAGFVVFIGAFWPVFLNTVAGASSLPQRYRDSAAILGLKRWEYLARIVFPAALPHIFSGISVGLVFAFILLTVAELFGANAGLGRFIQLYADYADYPRMVAGILYTGVVVLIATEVLEQIKRRALFWVK